MWLRLAYLNLPTAFKRIQAEGRPLKAAISGRYKQVLKKQFYIHGLPWIYERPLNPDINPRHKKPKGHRTELRRLERVERIKTALISMPDEELKFRQERLNKRPLKGMDKIVQKTLPSWISMRKIGDGPVEIEMKIKNREGKLKSWALMIEQNNMNIEVKFQEWVSSEAFLSRQRELEAASIDKVIKECSSKETTEEWKQCRKETKKGRHDFRSRVKQFQNSIQEKSYEEMKQKCYHISRDQLMECLKTVDLTKQFMHQSKELDEYRVQLINSLK